MAHAQHSDAFQLGAVLSDRAKLAGDTNLKEVAEFFEDVSFQRKDVVESERMLKQLEQALKASNRVEIFPNLTSSWTSIMITENKLVDLSEKIIDVRMLLTKGKHSAKLIALNKKRKKLRAEFAKIPKTSAQFQDRKARVKARYSELRRESFLLDQGLEK